MSFPSVPSLRYGGDGSYQGGLFCNDGIRFRWIHARYVVLVSKTRWLELQVLYDLILCIPFPLLPALFLVGGRGGG